VEEIGNYVVINGLPHRESLLQTEAVLAEIQNRLDPHPALPMTDGEGI